jgi:eukaryotic-like serine/threonine-protein kinase
MGVAPPTTASQRDVIDLITAGLADRYLMDRELGRGGMATVYLARDLRHGRLVALKVLHHELGSLLAAGRFAREIGIAARLNHPNILPLLDSGAVEARGVGPLLYYVMPYVEGGRCATASASSRRCPSRRR